MCQTPYNFYCCLGVVYKVYEFFVANIDLFCDALAFNQQVLVIGRIVIEWQAVIYKTRVWKI